MVVFMQKYVYWSLIMVNFQAIMMVLLVGHIKPFSRQSDNRIELYNEFSTLVVNYHLMCFTDFVSEVDTRELVGKSLVYVTGGNLLINLLVVFG
jgi:hypothetical protein